MGPKSTLLLFVIVLGVQSGGWAQAPSAKSSTSTGQVEDEVLEIEDDESVDPNAFTAPEEERPNPPAFQEAQMKPSSGAPPLESFRGFRKPPGPPEGGTLRVPHPDAAKGLLRIEKNGVYQYKVPLLEKSRAAGFRIGYQSTPAITSTRGVSFGNMYGSSGLYGLVGDYEWMPFRRFGSLGLQLGSGLVTARGNGRFADGSLAEETYSLYVIPLSLNVVYRFEYVRRQWIVPFVYGGGTVYGLVEARDDGKTPTTAAAPAVAGGGGVHFNISRWDQQSSFILAREYGVADLWLTIEAKAVQGLNADLDFTNQSVSAGVTVDY